MKKREGTCFFFFLGGGGGGGQTTTKFATNLEIRVPTFLGYCENVHRERFFLHGILGEERRWDVIINILFFFSFICPLNSGAGQRTLNLINRYSLLYLFSVIISVRVGDKILRSGFFGTVI